MKDNTNLKAVVLVSVTIIVVLASFLFGNGNKKSIDEKPDVVTNPSTFYTVNSCIYRYITYLSAKDSKNLLLVLDKKYVKDNKITKGNVQEIESINQNSTFVSKKMYSQKTNNNITKFYVYGYIQPNEISDFDDLQSIEYQEAYYIVYLDSINSTFSIAPYDGNVFMEGDIDGK